MVPKVSDDRSQMSAGYVMVNEERLTQRDSWTSRELGKAQAQKGKEKSVEDQVDVVPLVLPVLRPERNELLNLLKYVADRKEAKQDEKRDILRLGLDRERVRDVDAGEDDVAHDLEKVLSPGRCEKGKRMPDECREQRFVAAHATHPWVSRARGEGRAAAGNVKGKGKIPVSWNQSKTRSGIRSLPDAGERQGGDQRAARLELDRLRTKRKVAE